MELRLGIDTGGTFTDFIWVSETGDLEIHKEPSTPSDPSQAILRGLEKLHIPTSAAIVHGSTVATNALLEQRGARTVLITTKGFGDVLEIGRQNRPDLYALVPIKPPTLIPAELRFEVNERVSSQGNVLVPLDKAELEQLLSTLKNRQIESVAVCLLFSFLVPDHEQQIREQLQLRQTGEDSIHISLSSDILPEYREYERTATTVINAYVAPLMTRYLNRLAEGVAPRPLAVMQSNGGIIGASMAGEQAARTVLSGPAGGVVGARYIASAARQATGTDYSNLITFDMGGTSTDVALCPGQLPMTAESEIAGLPLRLSVIDIHTVGAGGGSLAYVDAGGALHVGPESAGADPGPACYSSDYAGWRNQMDRHFAPGQATVSDANLVLGRLDADHFLGGAMRLNEAAARAAVSELARQIGAESPEAAAADILRVANATMERAIRRISVERGHDPRRFTLLAFGGGGPLHACDLARALQIPRVLIPPTPGVLSALGMLAANPTRSYSRTVMQGMSGEAVSVEWLESQFQSLVKQALDDLAADGHEPGAISWQYELDMRYLGQSHELTIFWDQTQNPQVIIQTFHEAHQQRYSYHQQHAAVELVTIRLSASVPISPPKLVASIPLPQEEISQTTKSVWINGRQIDAAFIERTDLSPGSQFAGPAVITQYDTTTLVPEGWSGQIDALGNLLLTVA
ncbi:MAG: hydantoinase/oxoprolinase family protein [Chloroflexota bacterium]